MDLEAFSGYTVAHPHLVAADRSVRSLLRAPGDASIIFLIGPTGAGKSTLLTRVKRVLATEGAERMAVDQGYLPFVSTIAVAPSHGDFSFGGLYRDLLEAMDEPGVDLKRRPDLPSPRGVARPRATADDLKRALVRVVRERHVPVIMIDDAHHIGISGRARRLIDDLDVIKGLADVTGAKIILAGTYRLAAFRNLSDQIGRRSRDVHLSRYRRDVPEEATTFNAVIDHLIERMPVPLGLSERTRTTLYEGSAGCVGVLRNWLSLAASEAIEAGARRVTLEHLRRTRMAGATILEMAKAIESGELAWSEDAAKLARAAKLLGGSAPAREMDAVATRPKPGRRSPQRDRTGTPERIDVSA